MLATVRIYATAAACCNPLQKRHAHELAFVLSFDCHSSRSPPLAALLPTILPVQVGVEIIQRAIRRPAKTIANNAGLEGDVIVGKLLEQVRGWVACCCCCCCRASMMGQRCGVWTEIACHAAPGLASAGMRPCTFYPAMPQLVPFVMFQHRYHVPIRLPNAPIPCPPSPVQEGDEDVGFNAAVGRFENMVSAGVIDPMKVHYSHVLSGCWGAGCHHSWGSEPASSTPWRCA